MENKINSSNKIILITLRYILLLVLVLNSYLIYKIFTPLTIYSTVFLLRIFYPVIFFGNQILINHTKIIEIIPACVAGSAYLFLLILNLFVAMKPKQRAYSILLSFGLLFILNMLRIFILSILLVNNFEFFYLTHKLSWYILSTLFVVGIWFLIVKIFTIKETPIVSDINYFIKEIRESKNKTN